MGDVYHEQLIKRKTTVIDILTRILFILLTLSAFSISFLGAQTLIGIAFFALSVVFAYLTRYMFQRTNVEYEYSFLSGEIQVDRVFGKARRKHYINFDMTKVEVVAHEESDQLEQFERQNYNFKDVTSLNSDARIYVAFVRDVSGLTKIAFEPNDEILEDMKNYAPRKVYIDETKKFTDRT